MAIAKPDMGRFTAIGMRTKVEDPTALVINTCSGNDTADRGDPTRWTWANPTNRAFLIHYYDVTAVSVECLWQGTKAFRAACDDPVCAKPYDRITLGGDWRRGKARRPLGAYAGRGAPLITDPGEARRTIYLPAYRLQILRWLEDADVASWVERARRHNGPVYLRDFDTGRGVDRRGPMSHAWVLACWLNTGRWPGLDDQ